jgi:hypothetical protein
MARGTGISNPIVKLRRERMFIIKGIEKKKRTKNTHTLNLVFVFYVYIFMVDCFYVPYNTIIDNATQSSLTYYI